VGVSLIDPDGIGIEVQTADGSFVFDLYRWRDGRQSLCFGTPPGHSGFEVDLPDFHAMVDRCLRELNSWETNLRAEDGPWRRPSEGRSPGVEGADDAL
jgi:hypothetical protein